MRRLAFRPAGCALVAVCLFAAVMSGCGSGSDCGSYRFDKKRWFAAKATEGMDSPRVKEFERLKTCKVLIGRSKPEIRRMLGRPGEALPLGSPDWVYTIGWADFLGGSARDMVIEFGADGKVREIHDSKG